MEKELERILYNIKQKTGITVDCSSENGLVVASSSKEFKPINVAEFSGVYQSAHENRTYFKFGFANTAFIGAINGCDEISKNYANLIVSVIENTQSGDVDQSFEAQLAAVITGDATKNRTERFIEKYSIGKCGCYAMLFKSNKNAADVKEFLNNYSTNGQDVAVKLDDDACAFVKFIDNEVDYGYYSPTDYAKFILQAAYEELGINVTAFVGGKVDDFSNIAVSFQQALETMRLSKTFDLNSGARAYKDFMLVKIIEDLPNNKIKELLDVLIDENGAQVFKDDEIVETAEEFLNNNLNISETARVLYIHRNTLMYRIDKIEKHTGLDIRKFGDALTFRIISILNKLSK